MTRTTIPAEGTRSHKLLLALLKGPGTFYQVCERADFDIHKGGIESPLRRIFDFMIGGNVRLVGNIYTLTDAARASLTGAGPAPYIGQVAGPAYRGTPYHAPVRIVRRAAGARA